LDLIFMQPPIFEGVSLEPLQRRKPRPCDLQNEWVKKKNDGKTHFCYLHLVATKQRSVT
jgi:hypothetical protein